MNCQAFWNNENLVFFFLFFPVIVVVLNVVSDVIVDAYDVFPSLTGSIAVIELADQSIGQRLRHFVVNGFDNLQKINKINKVRTFLHVRTSERLLIITQPFREILAKCSTIWC